MTARYVFSTALCALVFLACEVSEETTSVPQNGADNVTTASSEQSAAVEDTTLSSDEVQPGAAVPGETSEVPADVEVPGGPGDTPIETESEAPLDTDEQPADEVPEEGGEPSEESEVVEPSEVSETLEDSEVAGLIDTLTQSVCAVLTRCCSLVDRGLFFEGIAIQQRIIDAGLDTAIPPAVAWDDFECEVTLKEVYEVQPFGAWVDAVEAGLASYDAGESSACLEALDNAACGEEVTDALFDSTCFGFSPPMNALSPRRMFTRTAAVGEVCMPLSDGVGGAIFGTCDPTVGWCCRLNASGACGLAPDAEGTCVAAGDVGESCGFVPTMSFCRTGLYCGVDTCEAESLEILQEGETCYDDLGLFGDCVDSYCDMFGTRICEPLKEVGAGCEMGYECLSGTCNTGLCSEADYCVGS